MALFSFLQRLSSCVWKPFVDHSDTQFESIDSQKASGRALRNESFPPNRPSFDALPLKAGHPQASAWGLWGPDDELGTLNLITEDVVTAARSEIRTGAVVSLKYDNDCQSTSAQVTWLTKRHQPSY